jgi:hypothetical protein
VEGGGVGENTKREDRMNDYTRIEYDSAVGR